jgi:hypothetical protein
VEVRRHEALDDFRAAAAVIYCRNPVLFTIELTILHGDFPVTDPLLLTAWSGEVIMGAALQTSPYPLLCSGLPVSAIDDVVSEVRRIRPDLVGVFGIRAAARQFADAWQAATGSPCAITMEERLYRLRLLRRPARVAGLGTTATDDDAALANPVANAIYQRIGFEPFAD